MEKNSYPSTKSWPKSLIILSIVSLVFAVGGILVKAATPEDTHEIVRWVDPGVAIKRAKSANKPILYFFTADWCGPCKLLKKQVFHDAQAVKRINHWFVPVKLVDRSKDAGKNPALIKKLQQKYKIRSFPTLIVDSPASPSPLILTGYKTKKKTMKFLEKSIEVEPKFDLSNHSLIEWKDGELLDSEEIDDKKPTLILFWDEGEDLNFIKYFSTGELVTLINEEFAAYKVENSKNASKAVKKLIKEFDIHKFPTLVVTVDDKQIPHYLFDLTNTDNTYDFLAYILDYLPEEKDKSKTPKRNPNAEPNTPIIN